MTVDEPVAIVLAAGKGTRMGSDLPKVLHEVSGRPMIEYVLDAVHAAGVRRVIVVVGFQAEVVQSRLAAREGIEFALQAEQLGTGHAVMACEEALVDHDGPVLVLAGDTPLLKTESLAGLLEEQRAHGAACVVGTAQTDANQGLGRIVRGEQGDFLRIVEQKDTTPAEAAIREINTGCFAFDCRRLFEALSQISPRNNQGEYYLTDCPAFMREGGQCVIASCRMGIDEAMGVNTPSQLADVERKLRERSSPA